MKKRKDTAMGQVQEKPCWLCESSNAIRGKCIYHALEPILGQARSLSVDLESVQQNQMEWEERALKAESEITRLTAQSNGQREALWRYAHHDETCDGHIKNRKAAKEILGSIFCSCGYEKILSQVSDVSPKAKESVEPARTPERKPMPRAGEVCCLESEDTGHHEPDCINHEANRGF